MSYNLTTEMIRLAHANPHLRPHLLPLIKEAREFDTDEALKKYLEEHPKADPSNHWVKKDEGGGKAEDEPEGEDKGKAEDDKAEESSKPKHKSTPDALFSEEELGLPDVAPQPVRDPKKLFEHAADAHQDQLKWLNLGQGIDRTLGAAVIRGDQGDPFDLDQEGPIVLIGPMKRMERSKEKVDSKYGGDWSQLVDVVRASIAVDSPDQIPDLLNTLRESGMEVARAPNDRFTNPTEAGYRDLSLSVRYPNGHVGELQIHLKDILKVKEKAHKLYEKTRSMAAVAKREGRTDMTPEEQAIVDEANSEMKRIFTSAYERALGTGSGKKASGIKTAKKQHYDWEGTPAVWITRKFPYTVDANGKKHFVYELDKFFLEASPVAKNVFDKLLDAAKEHAGNKGKVDKKGSLRARIIRKAHAAGPGELRNVLLGILKD